MALSRTPSRLIFVDTETKGTKSPTGGFVSHSLRLGVAIFVQTRQGRKPHREVFSFTSSEQFWKWCYDKLDNKYRTIVYAHNARFDMTVLQLWREMIDRKLSPKYTIEGCDNSNSGRNSKGKKWKGLIALGPAPFIMQLAFGIKRIDIVDTLNYWRCTLNKLGDSVGLGKTSMPDATASEGDWFQYCERDCEIIERAIVSMLDSWRRENLGTWAPSAPMLASNCLSSRFRGNELKPHHNDDVRKLERLAYYGGEVFSNYIGDVGDMPECYDDDSHKDFFDPRPRIGGPVYALDVRSLYPSVMIYNKYPTSLVGCKQRISVKYLSQLLDEYQCIATVKIAGLDARYPKRTNGRLDYPVGTYWTSLADAELRYALEQGHITEIGYVSYYDAADIFTDYVRYWWNRRADAIDSGNSAEDGLCKLMLNSIYGKFGRRANRWENTSKEPANVPLGTWHRLNTATGEVDTYRSICWHVQKQCPRGEHKNAMPSIAACVTSHGRVVMRRIREMLPANSVLYQDTDGIVVTEAAMMQLSLAGKVRDNCLGFLELKERCECARFLGVRNYIMGTRVVLAGLPANARRVGGQTWVIPKFEDVPALLARRPDGTIRMRLGTVAFEGATDPACYDAKGWRTPHVVLE